MKFSTIVLTLLLIVSTFNFNAQDIFGRRKKDLFEFRVYRRAGWIFSPGLTYTPNYVPKSDKRDIAPKGRLAVYGEIGRFKVLYEGGNFFNYYDYSLAYKRLSGTEEFNDVKAVFKQNFALVNFNLNNIWQLSDYKFIQNSIGANLDYKFLSKHETNGSDNAEPNNTNNLLMSLHYKIGMGFKTRINLFIIPSIEFPILNILEFEKGKSTYGIFSSRYKPVIFSVRFAFLKKRGKMACPDNKLSPEDKKKQQMHMMGQ